MIRTIGHWRGFYGDQGRQLEGGGGGLIVLHIPFWIGHMSPDDYPYAHLLPAPDPSLHYPPLIPFHHIDPAHRALLHSNPRSFLDTATVIHLTPVFGSQVIGLNLADLDNNARDQLALEVHVFSFVLVILSQSHRRSLAGALLSSGTKRTSSITAPIFTNNGAAISAGQPDIHTHQRRQLTSFEYLACTFTLPLAIRPAIPSSILYTSNPSEFRTVPESVLQY